MDTKKPSRLSQKRKAILAAGAVLGIGALIILAAWNDTIWGDGIFGTGDVSWNVQGSVDGGATWDEFEEVGGAGRMRFDLGTIAPNELMPGRSVHAIFGLQEERGHLDATVIVAAPVTDEFNTLGQVLNVRIVDLGTTRPSTFTGTEGTEIANYTLAHGVASAPVTIAAGGQRWLGFVVGMPDGTRPSGLAETVQAAWEMQAESVEPTP